MYIISTRIMILAPQELENSASKYAAEAIRLDSQGSRLKAIKFYQRAIEALNKLIQIYPEYKLNKIYLERSNAYLNRIKSLQMSNVLEEDEGKSDENLVGNDIDSSDNKTGNEIRKPKESLGEEFDNLIMKEKPKVSWKEVIGLDDAKRAIRESIVYPTKRPDLFPLGWPRGMLLYGPPGCGKTLLAAAAAAEIDGYFINVDAAAMMSKWLGEAEKNVSKLFKMANKLYDSENIPILLFIDEMDGITNKAKNSKLYVIGATNKPWSLEAGFLRRFQKRVYVTLPDNDSRNNLFKQYTSPLKKDKTLKIDELSKLVQGYSASDIKDICQAAQLRVVNELFESGKAMESESNPRPISMNDFKEIIKIRKPTVTIDMIRAYMRWSEQFKAL